MIMSLVFTALTGLVILNQVRDLESHIFHLLKISGIRSSAYYLANLTISVGRYLVLYLPVIIFKCVIYGKSDWHWYPKYNTDHIKEQIVLDCSECMQNRLTYVILLDLFTKFSFALETTAIIYFIVFLKRKNPSRIFSNFFLVLYLFGFACNIMLQYHLSDEWRNKFFKSFHISILYLLCLNPFIFVAQNPLIDSYMWTNA